VNTERYQELLGRLFEGELSGSESEELVHALEKSPELRRDLRQHLVLWEAWSQDQLPERSAEAFIRACKTRLRVEREGADAFTDAVRAEIQIGESSTFDDALLEPGTAWRKPEPLSQGLRGWIEGRLSSMQRRTKAAWAGSFAMAAIAGMIWTAVHPSAHAMTISGEGVCRACQLHEGHQHLPAIRVVSAGVTNIYYLESSQTDAGVSFCLAPRQVVAKGFLKKDGTHVWLDPISFSIQKPPNSMEKWK
jgi:hypothetical protein